MIETTPFGIWESYVLSFSRDFWGNLSILWLVND
jgi:hypothetical protein